MVQSRSALSSVVVTITLICATLLVALPLSAFVFGTLASHVEPAEITVTTVSISHDFSTCQLQVLNLGSGAASVTGVALFYPAGPNANSAHAVGLDVSLSPGAPTSVDLSATCAATLGSAGPASVSEMFTGVVSLSNGGVAYFAGRYS